MPKWRRRRGDLKKNDTLVVPQVGDTHVIETEYELSAWRDLANRFRYFLGAPGWGMVPVPESSGKGIIYVDSQAELVSLAKKLTSAPEDRSALDIGSGVRPFGFRRFDTHVCLEPFKPYADELASRYRNQGNIVPLVAMAPDALVMFPDESFDAVILTDVIEHMSREDGFRTLQEAKRIARNRVHVFTPNGFMAQHVGAVDEDEWGFSGNELQTHLSGWTAEDFKGWQTVICNSYHQNTDSESDLDEFFGALWATWVRPSSPQSRTHARLVMGEVHIEPVVWEKFLNDFETKLLFCDGLIDPSIAPWSFQSRPPKLPSTLVSVSLFGAEPKLKNGLTSLGTHMCCPTPEIQIMLVSDVNDFVRCIRASADIPTIVIVTQKKELNAVDRRASESKQVRLVTSVHDASQILSFHFLAKD